MSLLIFLLISSSGVNSLLLPASPAGVSTSFSISKDAEAVFYNPANLNGYEDYNLYCSYNRFYLSMQSVSLALSKKIKSVDFGLAFINFDYGDIEWHPNYPSEDSLVYYTANDFSMILSSKIAVSENGNVGISIKYISESIYIYSDHALAFDIGFSYFKTPYGVTFGASNCGTKISLNNEEVNLPARLSMGGFYDLKKLSVSTDVHYLVNNGIFEFGVGIRVPVYSMMVFDLAAQYRESFYPGFGVTLKTGGLAFRYAGSLYPKNLGMISTFGIGFEF